jgi:hypothetical protein
MTAQRYRVSFQYKVLYFGDLTFETREDAQAFIDDPDYGILDTDQMCLCENWCDPDPRSLRPVEVDLICPESEAPAEDSSAFSTEPTP